MIRDLEATWTRRVGVACAALSVPRRRPCVIEFKRELRRTINGKICRMMETDDLEAR
jgi:hypothetical protein